MKGQGPLYGITAPPSKEQMEQIKKMIDPDNTGMIRFDRFKKLMLLAVNKEKEKGNL